MTSLLAEHAAPRYLTAPDGASAAGDDAVELAATAGLVLDPWQADFLRVALRERSGPRWAAKEVALVCPRQNGKGSILEARELAGLFLFGERLILHSAHEFKTAAEAFRRVLFLVQNTPDLDRQVQRVSTAHGSEGIELRNGARLRFVARTSGSGRGFSGDCVILDEAYELSDNVMAALLPTLSARPDPQLWYTSSAPLPEARSDVLRRLCVRGREGSPSLAYGEFCADPSLDAADPVAWAQANPAMSTGRLQADFIEMERVALDAEGFDRERLGRWRDAASGGAFDVLAWGRLAEAAPLPRRPVFAVAVAPDRSWSAVAAGWLDGDVVRVEVADYRPETAWLPERVAELRRRHGGKVLLTEEAAGLADGVVVAGRELRRAEALFDDRLTAATLRHAGQAALDVAVRAAVWRPQGDGQVLDRRGGVEISPLVAVCVAAWGAAQPRQRPRVVSLAPD